jgi:hypothetical protein
MSSDAEILTPRVRVGDAGPEPDSRRWAALIVMLVAAFMNLIASRVGQAPWPR